MQLDMNLFLNMINHCITFTYKAEYLCSPTNGTWLWEDGMSLCHHTGGKRARVSVLDGKVWARYSWPYILTH